MKAIEFKEANVVFGKNQPDYIPLPMYLHKSDAGEAIAVWELDDEDIEILKHTKRLYVTQLTFNNRLQPISLTLSSPFKPQSNG